MRFLSASPGPQLAPAAPPLRPSPERSQAQTPKQFWKSKTLWFNALVLVVLIACGFGFADFEADPNLEAYAAMTITFVNLILRLTTRVPLAARGE